MASQDSFEGQKTTPNGTMEGNGFDSVLRTGRRMATVRRNQWTDGVLIAPDGKQQQLAHNPSLRRLTESGDQLATTGDFRNENTSSTDSGLPVLLTNTDRFLLQSSPHFIENLD